MLVIVLLCYIVNHIHVMYIMLTSISGRTNCDLTPLLVDNSSATPESGLALGGLALHTGSYGKMLYVICDVYFRLAPERRFLRPREFTVTMNDGVEGTHAFISTTETEKVCYESSTCL